MENTNQNAALADADVSAALEQATEFIMSGVGPMPPAVAVGGMIGAIERIACCGGQGFAMGVAQLLDEAAGELRRAVISAGAPQIEVAK